MKKQYILISSIVVILLIAFYIFRDDNSQFVAKTEKDATYTIDGEQIKLVNGVAETEIAPGSATKIITKYFGNEAKYDLDGDGREDKIFLLTQNSGGSGTFFYVVAALNKKDGYIGTQATFLGDRIAPQTTEVSSDKGREGIVTINYADRRPAESFAATPSLGKSMRLIFDAKGSQFVELK